MGEWAEQRHVRVSCQNSFQGQNQKTTEIICERIQLGPRNIGGGPSGSNPREANDSEGVKEEIPEINLDDNETAADKDLPF